jgi:hypothetical protein
MRNLAVERLVEAGQPEAVSAVYEELLRQTKAAQVRARWRIGAIVFGVTGVLLHLYGAGTFIGDLKDDHHQYARLIDSVWTFVQFFCLQVTIISFGDAALSFRRRAIDSLRDLNDPKLIIPFASGLRDRDEGVRTTCAEALQRILPLVHRGHVPIFSDDVLKPLLAELKGANVALCLAILKALGEVGDARAMSTVEAVAAGAHAGRNEQVGAAAEAILPIIQARAEEARQAQSLLRASADPGDVGSSTLVRPAFSVELESGCLLRATDV